MDAFTDPTVEQVTVMSSAQVGKTEIVNNVVGYHIDHDPCPTLLLQPTLEMAEAWSKDRLAPMLRDTPRLKNKVKDNRTKDSNNTIRQKNSLVVISRWPVEIVRLLWRVVPFAYI